MMNEATQYTEYIPYIRFLLGMLIVAAVAGMSFNRPSWARTYTVFVRYAASAFLFIFCQVAIYYVLILVAPYIVRSLTSSAQPPLAVFSSTLVSVLLTVFIAQHSLIDRTLRNALHNLAGIPDVALKLTQTLSDAQFHANEEETRNAKLLLLRRGIDSDQEWLAPAQGSQELFLKATIVYLKVKQWHEHGSYSVFLEEVSHDFDRLRERFDRISLKFSRTLSQIER